MSMFLTCFPLPFLAPPSQIFVDLFFRIVLPRVFGLRLSADNFCFIFPLHGLPMQKRAQEGQLLPVSRIESATAKSPATHTRRTLPEMAESLGVRR